MKTKRLLAWFLCVGASLGAGGQLQRTGLTVDESRCQIHTSANAVTPVLAIENPGSETTARVRAELVDTADVVRATGETESRLHPGLNQVSVSLHGWTQKEDEWNDSIWYRVRYRVIPSQTGENGAEGILALASKADGVFDLRVVASRAAVPGVPFRVRVYTRSLSTLLPMPAVQISAELESDSEDADLKLASITNSHGYTQLEFKMPAEGWGSSATLKVVARKGQVVRDATQDVEFLKRWRFFTTTDKPLYQPGQVVHIRTLLQDWSRHAVAKTPVTFTIADEEQTLAFRAAAETSRFGVARADWEVPENLRLGQYAITVTGGTDDTDDQTSSQTIRISRYELPTFTVNVAPDRGYYLPGQTPAVEVSAGYLFGKPVTRGHVKVARETDHSWNFNTQKWDTNEEQAWEGDTDSSGKFVAHIDVSDDQKELPENNIHFRDLDYAAYFTDASTGKTEQRRFRLRISSDPIHLYVIEGGNFAAGRLPLEFYVSASYADGTPAQCEVAVYMGSPGDDKAAAFLRSVKTNHYGVAKILGMNLPPLPSPSKDQPNPNVRLVLEAHDRQGRRGHNTQDFWDAGDRLAIQVMTGHALYRPGEAINVDLYTSRRDATLLLDVLHENRVIQSQPVRVHNGHAFVVLPYVPSFQGELAIAAYSPVEAENEYYMPMGARIVLYPHDPELKVTAKFDHATYRPGEDAVLDLHVRGDGGAPVEAALGSVIFDQAVEERARTDSEFGSNHGYGFNDYFRSYWYEPAELGGLKRKDLDHLDVAEPFGDDLQLAAEVLLLNRWVTGTPMVFGGANYPDGAGSTFRQLLDRELAPVKKALESVYERSMQYPHDDSSLRRALGEQGADFDKVLDPWGSPFRTKFSFRQGFAVMEFVSSGPDKKPDTADDFTALTVQRWYFRPTAEAITKAMAEFHKRTGEYIRDVVTLKAELAKAGVQWDTLRDPWGGAYLPQFGVSNGRYTLTVMSGGPDGRFESGPSSDDFPIWTEFSDYFSETAVKIDVALARYFAATQKFPQDEAEFYKVLDDAQISRNLLVDAWGHRARLVFNSQATYSDRIVMDYSELVGKNEGQTSTTVQPETSQHAFIHLYSAGQDGIAGNGDDFELAVFSREITRQNSTMMAPAKTPEAIPLSGGSGAITGVVTDPSGAVVMNAKVTARLWGEVPFEAITDSSGRYTLRDLPTGFYWVTVEMAGFRTSAVNRVPVKSLNTTELNLRLSLGSVSEMVEVTSEALSVQASTSEVAVEGEPRPSNQTQAGGPIATPRLREFFPETLLWEPMLETDRQGHSRLHFKFADSITNWKLSLVASSVDGQMGLLDTGIKTFQPFFVEHEPPAVLTQGDEIALPVVLRNYLEKSQTLRVEMKSEPWFKLLTPPVRETIVAAGESERAEFRFRVTGAIGDVKQRVTAANRETGDAVEKPVRIHPDGEPRTVTASRMFTGQGDLDVAIPDYALAGSVQAELKIYPNLMAHVLESSRSLLERPYGCGEQTISSTYPNVMLLRLYQQAGKPQDEVYRAALHFARLGYERLLSYQHNDGGISVWKQDKPDLALTAYGLRFLTDASEFIEVDANVVDLARQWLLRQQGADGGWQNLSLTAYVTLALAKSTQPNSPKGANPAGALPLEPSLMRALDYLRNQWSTSNDPYAIAQVALAAWQSGDKVLGAQANAKLRGMGHGEGDSSYWALETNTLFYGWGTAGRVETTALAVQALAAGSAADDDQKKSQDQALIEKGLIFLIAKKDGDGDWYSGQTTINVLEAFLPLIQPPARTESAAGVAEIMLNGEKVASVKMPGAYEVVSPLLIDLAKFVKPGVNHVSLTRAGASPPASMQAVVRFYIPWDRSTAQPGSGLRTGDSDALALRVHYDRMQISQGEEIRCQVHAERIAFRGYGMLLAEIGLPPGAVVDRGSLEKIMSGSFWEISQYEIRPDRLVVYLWPKAGGTDFDFTFRPRYGMNALTAPSILYDYYNPEAQVVVQPSRIEVRQPPEKSTRAEN